MAYEPSLLIRSREKLKIDICSMPEVTEVKIAEDALRRNNDGELLDKLYVKVANSTSKTAVAAKVRKFIEVYEQYETGNVLEFNISHSAYVLKQDTLPLRIKKNKNWLIEAMVVLSILSATAFVFMLF